MSYSSHFGTMREATQPPFPPRGYRDLLRKMVQICGFDGVVEPLWALKIQFQLLLSPDSHSLSSELSQTCLAASSLGFGVSCNGKLLEDRNHDYFFFHPSLCLPTHAWQSQAQSWTPGGTLESLASDFGRCLGNVFSFSVRTC